MQNPNEDSEWNDALRRYNIIPEKEKEKEITEEDIVNMLEQTVESKQQGMLFLITNHISVSTFFKST